MKPTADEAEEALNRAFEAKAMAEVLGESLNRMHDYESADLHEIYNLSLVADVSVRLLEYLIEFVERVRDSAPLEDDT